MSGSRYVPLTPPIWGDIVDRIHTIISMVKNAARNIQRITKRSLNITGHPNKIRMINDENENNNINMGI